MVQTMKISNKRAAPATGLHRPVPSGSAFSLETFEDLSYFIKRFESVLWEDKKLEIAIDIYKARKGKWDGILASDDIWPIEMSKWVRPFSDFQLKVLEDLREKRKAFQKKVEAVLQRKALV